MVCFTGFTHFSMNKMLTRYFFSINISVVNTADLRTWFYVKNKLKNVKNKTFYMPQIKKVFLKENIFSGQTHSSESNFNIQIIIIL